MQTTTAPKGCANSGISSQKLSPSPEPTAEDFALLWAQASVQTRLEIASMVYAAAGVRRISAPLRERLRILAFLLRSTDRAAGRLIRNVWG